MKHKITVLDGKGFASQYKQKDGTLGKWGGNYQAQCIVYSMGEDGVEKREVGVLRIPNELCTVKVDEKEGGLWNSTPRQTATAAAKHSGLIHG
jgi:hypothetical protein